MAVRATAADILATKLAGGRTGEQEARARLNTSTAATSNTGADLATKKRGPPDVANPQDQSAASIVDHAKYVFFLAATLFLSFGSL